MKLPIQITARNMSLSEAAKNTIREKAEKLDSFHNNVMSCRVLVEVPHRHQHKGVLYNVRIDMTVPGGELVVKREPHEDLYVSIRDAFDAAKRQLQDFAQRQRGDVKAHEEPPTAQVVRMFPDEGYGFLQTGDGREIYFHRNSLVNGEFQSLEVGTEVRFVETMGEEGPQASTVSVVGKH
jgi:ribosomal subunit interface protein